MPQGHHHGSRIVPGSRNIGVSRPRLGSRPWCLTCHGCGWRDLSTLALLAAGLVGVEGLRRSSRPIHEEPIAALVEDLAASLGIARRVAVGVCDRIAAPVLVGIVKPMILLPPAALGGWGARSGRDGATARIGPSAEVGQPREPGPAGRGIAAGLRPGDVVAVVLGAFGEGVVLRSARSIAWGVRGRMRKCSSRWRRRGGGSAPRWPWPTGRC